MARFNRVATNRILGPLTRVLPPFAEVRHRGRTSGREYTTPVWAFPTEDGYVIALTYGPQTHWAKNVLAANGCRMRTPAGEVPLGNARLLRDEEGLTRMPAVLRPALRAMGVRDFLILSR